MTPELTTAIVDLFRLQPAQKSALTKLGLRNVHDLLYHFPSRYSDFSELKTIQTLNVGEEAVVYGKVTSLKTSKAFRTKMAIGEAIIDDGTGTIRATWFHQPYIAKMLHEGETVKLRGKITASKKGLYLANPEFEHSRELPIDVADSLFAKNPEQVSYPVYPESRGLSSRWIYHAVQKILASELGQTLEDPIPEAILKKYNLPTLRTALIWIHSPKKESDSAAARKRFSFEEIFIIQLKRQRERKEYQAQESFIINKEKKDVEEFKDRFPFKATAAQEKAIATVLADFKKPYAMSRLLEGDVGSGKTAVAATTAYAVATSRPNGQKFGNLQVAYMVPTEILAAQHFESFIKYFSHLPINIGLITGSGCRKFPSKVNPNSWTDISRSQLLKWVANGEIPILIGTHALIQKNVAFKNLAYVIIDEQHRFGMRQRQKLMRKEGILPHLLSMTATPIPRTLALTIYGDLDLTLLDQMPAGRKPVITEIVLPTKQNEMYAKIREELKAGRQAYVICARIDEPDPDKELALTVKSVRAEAARLARDIFPEYEIGILHGKMKPSDKDKTMIAFAEHKIDILVATSVVEVGVNVPNATLITIEGAERFGLAQSHQLRGRVIRSNHQAYCFVVSEAKSQKTMDRLNALKTAANGFELAEHDLQLRGAGELSGGKQWGLSDIGMEAIRNIKMVEAARTEATELIESDAELSDYPALRERAFAQHEIHFE